MIEADIQVIEVHRKPFIRAEDFFRHIYELVDEFYAGSDTGNNFREFMKQNISGRKLLIIKFAYFLAATVYIKQGWFICPMYIRDKDKKHCRSVIESPKF